MKKLYFVVGEDSEKAVSNYSTGTTYYTRLSDAKKLAKKRSSASWRCTYRVMQVELSEPTEVIE